MSNTPLTDALREYAEHGNIRFHMPGHKGKSLPFELDRDLVRIDYTELAKTGNLYDGTEPIASAERIAARFYGAARAYFLTGGSTQGILTALGQFYGKTVLFDRNSHRAAVSGMALFDITPIYIAPCMNEEFAVTDAIDEQELVRKLSENPEISAFFVTSPSYYGIIQNITRISGICHEHKVTLIVDAAHGAHLTAIGINNAIADGADMEICSMHKTTAALGQSAILLAADEFEDIRRISAMCATSSPSYAMMASIECAVAHLLSDGGIKYREAARMVLKIREQINKDGIFKALESQDTCRLTVNTVGLCAREAYEILENECGISPEMCDNQNVVFIITCADGKEELDALLAGIRELYKYASHTRYDFKAPPMYARKILNPREAVFAESEKMPIGLCEGRICAETLTVYPPGVIILAPGEVVDKKTVVYLMENGYNISKDNPNGTPIRIMSNKLL